MDRISGLPAHPLLVHVPVVLIPLAAVGVLAMLLRRSWYDRYRWLVLGVSGIGALGAILAASSGEGLEEQIGAAEGRAAVQAVQDHAEAGDLARTVGIVFFVAVALFVLVPWFLERRAARATTGGDEPTVTSAAGPRWLRPALMVFVALAAVGSTVAVIDAGHSGASQAWEEYRDQGAGG
jgi:uncharacterized membrane protein